MPDVIPDLWPDEVSVTTVLTPLAILRYQAGQLRQRTQGLLEAEVQSETTEKGEVRHTFDLIAPVLDRYRYRLFTVDHQGQLVYPARIEAFGFSIPDPRPNFVHPFVTASSQNDFVEWIGRLLQSDRVRSVIHSLLAKSNEARDNRQST